VLNSKRLIRAHFWLAFVAFGLALLLGEWQMFTRSPLSAWIGDPELYYGSATAHGTAMGFGYAHIQAQLHAFASGTRYNDISQQMRNIARQMTPAEIEAAAQYYASQPAN
jgi:cytochrome c oxidase subunit I